MSSNNPYSSPTAEPSPDVSSEPSPPSNTLGAIAKRTFLAWEKLRLVYNFVLAALTGLMVALDYETVVHSDSFVMLLVEGAIGANLCFFAGPILDTYFTWLGLKGKWFRVTVFVVGTLFSCLLAFGILAASLLPNMN